jgi:hypothetical protein
MRITTRPVESDEDAKRVFTSLIDAYQEVARVEGDANKAFIEVYHSVKNEAVFIAEDETGAIVGSCCIYDVPGGFFYGAGGFFSEKWLHVSPAHRDGAVLRALLVEVATLCDHMGQPAFLRIFNPKRRHSQSHIARVAEDLCYYPAGAVIQVSPRKAS